MTNHLLTCAALTLYTVCMLGTADAQTYTRDRVYTTRDGVVNVYEIPLRDREEYNPTYEDAARRKADGYSLNNKELNALRRGAPRPKSGSIAEEMLLRRQQKQLDMKAGSKERVIESTTDQDIRRSEAVSSHVTESELELMKLRHELELKQAKAKLELELERKKKLQELKSGNTAPRGQIVFEEIQTTRSRATK